MLLQGLFIPLTCPFYRDGSSYLRKLEHNVARYSLSPAAGLVALPPGGEASSLTDAEKASFLQAAAETAGKTKVLLAGVEAASVRAVLEMITVAERFGFDAVLLSPPTDWTRLVHGHDARELLLFYTLIADQSSLPLVLWSDARPPYLQLPEEVVLTLAQHPNVSGVVDADLTIGRTQALLEGSAEIRRKVVVTPIFEAVTRRMLQAPPMPGPGAPGLVPIDSLSGGSAAVSAPTMAVEASPTIKTRTRELGLQLLSAGPVSDAVRLFGAGVAGAMPVLAACAPQACFEAYAAWKDGDLALAEERADRLRSVEDALQVLGPAAVKAGCDFNGYFGGLPRTPRLPIDAEHRADIEEALRSVRN